MQIQQAAACNSRPLAFTCLLVMMASGSVVSSLTPGSNSLVHEDLSIRDLPKLPNKLENKSGESLKELKTLLLSKINWKESLLSTKEIMFKMRELGHIIGTSRSLEMSKKIVKYKYAMRSIFAPLIDVIAPLILEPISVKDTLIGRNASETENQINSAVKVKLDKMNSELDKSWNGAFELAKVFDTMRKETKNFGSKAKSINSAAALLKSLDTKIVQAKEFCFNFQKALNYLYVSGQTALFYAREQYLWLSQKSQKSQEHLSLTMQLMEDNFLNIDRVLLTLNSIVSSFGSTYGLLQLDINTIPGVGGLSEEEKLTLALDKEQAVKDVETNSQSWDSVFESV